MQILWKKEIDEIKSSGYLKNGVSITDALIENFYNEILNDSDKELLKLAFHNNPEQSDLNKLLQTWDIEVKGGEKSLLLAYFMKLHPELKFTGYEGPRLKGLLNYFRFKNLKTIAHYSRIGRELNKAGIIPLVFKGGAIKYLRPELPRIMGDLDILVPEKEWLSSAKIALSLGYRYDKIDIHAIDIHPAGSDEGALDIHKYICMDTPKERSFLKCLYMRAKQKSIFGVNSLLPANEDLLFITLINLSRNLRNKTSQSGILYTLFDCKFLTESKRDFDWDIVRENARITGTEVHINFAVKFICKISPNILSDSINYGKFFEKETEDYSNMVMYNRFYLEDLRTKCRGIKISDTLLNSEKLEQYIILKPKYFFLKLLRNHPMLIKLFIKDLREGAERNTCN